MICQPASLEKAYIIWPSAGMLAAGCIYVGRHTWTVHILYGRRLATLCIRGAYKSADMLGACIYYMAVGWHACSRGAYMSLTHLEHAYINMVFGWHALQRGCIYVAQQ